MCTTLTLCRVIQFVRCRLRFWTCIGVPAHSVTHLRSKQLRTLCMAVWPLQPSLGGGLQGAERPLDWQDLQRFKDLPLVVTFQEVQDGKSAPRSGNFAVEHLDEAAETVVLRLADVKGNIGVLWRAVSCDKQTCS
jgi:hypothetical protein